MGSKEERESVGAPVGRAQAFLASVYSGAAPVEWIAAARVPAAPLPGWALVVGVRGTPWLSHGLGDLAWSRRFLPSLGPAIVVTVADPDRVDVPAWFLPTARAAFDQGYAAIAIRPRLADTLDELRRLRLKEAAALLGEGQADE